MSDEFRMTASDDVHVPTSHGVAPAMIFFLIASLLVIFMQGYFVAVVASGDGHVWPASNATKLELPPMNLGS